MITLTNNTKDMGANENIVARLKQWMDDEGMSSLTEYGANTPMYIYRMWGGEVPLAVGVSFVARLRRWGFCSGRLS